MSRRLSRRAAAALVALFLTAAAPAAAEVLISNINQNQSGFWDLSSHVQAIGFTTGANSAGYTLDSVAARFSADPSDLTVKLVTGLPGATTEVAALTNPSDLTLDILTFTAPTNTTLSANTTYWVMVEGSSGAPQSCGSDNEDAGGATGWSIANTTFWRTTTGTSWSTAGSSLMIRVSGDVVADTTAPSFSSASVSGDKLTITFNETLGAASSLANTAFTVKKTPDGGTEAEVGLSNSTAPSISGGTVVLTLANAVVPTDRSVKVSYTKPATGTANKIKDAAGNETDSFGDQAVANDTLPSITISGGSAVTEGTAAVFTVTADAAPVADLVVNLTVADDTDSDFVSSGDEGSKTVTITANTTSASYSVTTQLDTTDEENGDVTVTVATGTGYTVGSPSSATVTVNDDDDPPDTTAPSFSSASVSGDKLTITFNEALGAASSLANTAFTVKKTPDGGTEAEVGLHATTGPSISGGTVVLTLATAVIASDGGVKVKYDKPTTGTDNTVKDAAGNETDSFGDQSVANDTPPAISISGGSAVTEGTAAVFTVTADAAPSANLTVNLTVADASGSDFVAAGDEGSKTVTINSGATTATYSVDTVGDTTDEPDGEVTVTVAAGTGYTVGSPSSATVTVNDDDLSARATITGVAITSTPVHDANGDSTPDTYLRGDNIEVTVTWDRDVTWDVSATNADLRVRLTIGSTNRTASLVTGGATSGTARSATFSYSVVSGDTDADGLAVTPAGGGDLVLQVNGATVRAGGRAARRNHAGLTAQANHQVDGSKPRTAPDAPGAPTVISASPTSLSVSWSAPSNTGSASAVSDYDLRYFAGTAPPADAAGWIEEGEASGPPNPGSGTSATITGLTSGTTYLVQVRAEGDGLESLWSASGSGAPSAPDPVITIAAGTSPVTEGTAAEFTVTADAAPSANLTVNLTVADASGSDFVAAGDEGSKTVTINANATTATYSVDTVGDTTDEPDGEVTVTVASGTGYTVGSPSSDTVTVNDDDDPLNSAPTGSVTITGTVAEDQTLTADTSGVADEDGLGTFSYQWKRDGADISGATSSTYVLVQDDVGETITVTVSYTDGGGTAESLTSAATGAVANVNDSPTGSVTISGTVAEDQTLTADTSGVADADGLGTFSYQWKRDGADISGATSSTYVLVQDDVGETITVTVSYTDGGGTAESLTSAATGAVANVNDSPTGSVTISGTVAEDQTLTADTSGVADEDGLGTFSYQWKRDGADISGATSSTYVLVQDDVGETITVTVSYTDGGGTDESLTSAATGAVANVNDSPTGSVTITGTVAEDQTLTADTSGVADEDGLGTFSYQWKRGGADISGAASSTYVLVQDDVGETITVTVSYTDGGGTDESLTSAATGAVANVNDSPTGSVTITGTATQDRTLTANASGVADEDGLGTFSYQWKRGGTNISGATSTTYRLVQADVGSTITVTVSYTDGEGTAEIVESAATGTVASNATPVFTSQDTTASVAENSDNGTAVATIMATDADAGANITHSLDATSDMLFDIDSSSGAITVQVDSGSALDHEATPSITATVTATDNNTATATHDVTIAITNEDEPPGAMDAPTVTQASPNSINVSWTAPDMSGKPPITDYDVRYQATTDDVWIPHNFTGAGTSTTISSLHVAGGTYRVQVKAKNADGDNGWSDSGTVTLISVTLTISGGSPIIEGTAATFTVNASPASDTNLIVSLRVVEASGSNFVSPSNEGIKALTLAANATAATHSVPTQDDSTDEPRGSVTVHLVSAGSYSLGSPSSASVIVNDNDGTEDPNVTPRFTNQPSTASVMENSDDGTVVATVTAEDDDADTLSYSLDATSDAVFDIDSNGAITVQVDEGSALDHEAAPSITATVTANDGTTTASHTITISVTDGDEPPSRPAAPTVTGASTTSVSVTWTAPTNTGKPPITDYDVQYRASGDTNWTAHSFSGTGTSTTIPSLSPGTTYEVQVMAKNDEGDSAWSGTGTGDTNGDTTAPAFSSASVSGDKLTITFNEALGAASSLANTAFTVKKTPSGGTEAEVGLSNSTGPSISGGTVVLTLADAVVATDGGVKVKYDKPDSGTDNKIIDAAGNETDSFGDRSVTNATPPAISISGGGAVTEGTAAEFTVTADAAPSANLTVNLTVADASGSDFVSSGDEGSKTVTITANTTSASYSVTTQNDTADEENGEVTVTVATGTGYTVGSPSSATVTVNDDDDPPNSAPVFMNQPTTATVAENSDDGTAVATVTADDADTLTYSLDATSDKLFDIDSSSGAITVQVDSGSALDHEATPSITATVTATDTHNATATHDIRIDITDMDEPPGKPAAPNVAGASATSVTVSWSAPTNTGPAISDYDVRFRASGDTSWTDHSFTGTGTSTTISSLTEGTTYEVQVMATNAEGDSDWSDSGTGVAQAPSATNPTITIAAGTSPVTEGTAATFTVTASPAPSANLTVNLTVADASGSDFVASGDEGSKTVTINANATTAAYSVSTQSDTTDEPDGEVTVTVAAGTGYTVGSPSSGTVTVNDDDDRLNSAPTGSVTITGTVAEDQTLTADTSGVADADGLGTFSYQWKRGGADISGAASSTYVLVQDDVGETITVTVSYTDGGGTAESLTSAATGAVANVNDSPTGSVTITGTATQDRTLTANASGVADEDGLGTFSYQWKRGGTNISGATSTTYRLVQADVGSTITVTVSYTDGEGTAEIVESAATGTVASNATPVFTSQDTTASVAENSDNGTAVATIMATDADAGANITHSLDATSDMLFDIDSSSGAITVQVDSGSALDHEATPSITATVTATDNNTATATHEVTITITNEDEPPGAMDAPTVTEATSSSANVSWTAPDMSGKPPITDYDVRYKRTVSEDWLNHDFTGAGTSTTITELHESGGTYEVQVKAKNADGDSGWSASGTVTLQSVSMTISGGPAIIEGTAATFRVNASRALNTRVVVALRVSDAPGGDFVASSDEGFHGVALAANTTTATYSVPTQDDSTDESRGSISVSLAAGTGYSLGSPSSASVIVNDNDGTEDPNVTPRFTNQPSTASVMENSDDGTVVATVTAEDDDADTLSYSLDATSDAVFDIDSNGAITVQVDEGSALDHEAAPSITATVTANDGTTTASHTITISVTDGDEPPSRPAAPTVTGASTTSVSVTWTAPTNTGKPPITDYDVQYRASGDTNWTAHSFSGTGTSTTIPSLSPGTTYEVQVMAKNDEGDSAWSGTGTGDTSEPADTTAPSFSSASVSGDKLTITFNEALGAASSLANTAFTVKKTPSGGTEAEVGLSNSTGPSISGGTVVLTLADAVVATDGGVKVKYDKPDSGTDNKIIDAAGNETDSFGDRSVANDTPPAISISGGSAVTEGTAAEFTVTADAAPSANLTVNLTVADASGSDFVSSGDEGSKTVTITANTTSASYSVDHAAGDTTDEPRTAT